MNRAIVRNIAAGSVPLVLGLVAMVLALRMEIGNLGTPGPGLWPLLVSVLLVTSSLGVILTGSGADTEAFTADAAPIIAALVALGLFVMLFPVLGFAVPAFGLLVFWLRWISKESWPLTVVIAGITTAALYVLFAWVLGVPFPVGLLAQGGA